MGPIKIQFDHGTWWLVRKRAKSRCLEDDRGSCDPPSKHGRKWIHISDSLKGEEELEITIHELSHAADPRAGEEAIEEQARVIAKALWRLGWRRSA